MEILKIEIDFQLKTIMAQEKIGRGIYLAFDNVVVKNNKVLKIEFKESDERDEINGGVTKIGGWSFFTLKNDKSYVQYIFCKTASEEDFQIILRETAEGPEIHYWLKQAFMLKGFTSLGGMNR